MKTTLLKVSIRQNAIVILDKHLSTEPAILNHTTLLLIANAKRLGFAFSEDLLIAINQLKPTAKVDVLNVLKEITGVNKNWTPLVKGWDVPTGETEMDHMVTFIANLIGSKKGTRLQCGHIIPDNTFPLERYNGCPFCGTPFEFGEIENYGQGSKLKVLELWTEADLNQFFIDLLKSKTALDATQVDSLKSLLKYFSLPDIKVGMKETLMLVIDILIENDQAENATTLFKSPSDILRYLWYKHTGFLQIIEPKTLIKRISKNSKNLHTGLDESAGVQLKSASDLKLKYSRTECKRVAIWMNSLAMDSEKACEIMHPKRGMWIRFIRALRLAEYSKRKGFEKLAELLDIFYNEKYTVWQGRVNHFRLKSDAEKTFALLKQRPGLFARSLFSNMLWFGDKITLKHFEEIMDQIPTRLVLTLNMYAQIYFDKTNTSRSVKPLGGTNKRIPAHPLLSIYSAKQLAKMQVGIEELSLKAMRLRFSKMETKSKSIFIHPNLFNIPLAIGDRSETVQDLPSALMGTRFPLEGNTVRLFMQWGEGLPAQHLDMDLSCSVAYQDKSTFCSYSKLKIKGCKHSGDIRSIPSKVGTAEYIDIDVNKLARLGAEYVSFTCNAYSNGALSPNLVVGWMDSKFPMKISRKSGVAYDPSCVQHQVRVTQTLAKGLVFGVLDVAKREIVWMEMSFAGQIVQNLDIKGVKSLLDKLNSKLSIGNLLTMKAEAQGLITMDNEDDADEIYNLDWAMNPAKVTQLFLD